MRSLFRLFIGSLSFIVSLATVGCANDEATTPTQPDAEMVEIALVADMDEEATRLAIDGNTTRWEVGDRITVGLVATYYSTLFSTFEISSDSDISEDGKRATFRGEVTPGSYYGVAAIYPASETPSSTMSLRRDAYDNVYMSSYTAYDMPLNVDATTVLPIAFNHLMHKVDFKLSLADGYSSDDLKAESIAIEMTATADGKEVKFPLISNYDIRRNTLTQLKSEAAVTVYGSGSKLQTMAFPMGTMTNVVLTFKVYIDGECRYEIRKPESGTLSTLKMSAGKSTTVNLKLSEDNRINGGGDVIIQKAITLTVDKNTITANGTERATLRVVDEDGVDVTSQSEIFHSSGSRFVGTTFSTTTPGSYSFYAELNGVRSNTVTIRAEEVADTSKNIIFAEGVTLTSGWYDVNKVGQGDNGDIQMCWAASAANMIQWFQDRYVAAGNKLPSTAVTGPGKGGTYELALMDMFHSEWDNSLGGHVNEAIPWYFEGKLNGGEYATAGSQAVPLTAGGYWKSVWSKVLPHLYHEYEFRLGFTVYNNLYTISYNNYYLWGNGSDLLGVDRLQYVTDLVVESIERGVASMTVALSPTLNSNHHAVTLWGYEIDNATGLLSRVWITDSDDMVTEPKTRVIHEYKVSIGEGQSHVHLTSPDSRYAAGLYIVSICPFSGYGSAE